MKTIKVKDLIDTGGAELQLTLLAGAGGVAQRVVSTSRIQKPGLALTGYTEFVQRDRVQILGSTEIVFLDKMDPGARERACNVFCEANLAVVVCTKGMHVPRELVEACERTGTPLCSTPQTTDVFIERMESWLDDKLAPQTTMHGVLVEIYGIGVMLMGKSGIGKSELALDLVQRGHPLIADDIVTIRRRGADTLYGQGHTMTKHLLEIRGLGIVNVKDLFGVSAVREKKRIDLVTELVEWRENEEYDRLGLEERSFVILDVNVPFMTVPVRPGRNLGVIVEAAARNELLKSLGKNAALELHERLAQQLQRGRVKDDVE
jgi:HPr kinase/phosphorylase